MTIWKKKIPFDSSTHQDVSDFALLMYTQITYRWQREKLIEESGHIDGITMETEVCRITVSTWQEGSCNYTTEHTRTYM